MRSKRQMIFRIAALIIVIAIVAVMFVIGRAHTIYFDNKSGEYSGNVYEPYYKVNIIMDGESIAKLYDDERGMASIMGQTLTMTLEITDEKGSDPHLHKVSTPIPYNLDGAVINIPMLMAALPADAYMSEFIPVATEEETADEEVIIDEFDMGEGTE